MKIKKIYKNNLIKYCLIFLICLVFANAKVGELNPFLYAFFFAGLYVGINEKIFSIFALGASLLVMPTLQNFFITLTIVAVGVVVLYIHKLFKKSYYLPTNILTYIVSLVTFIYYNLTNIKFIVAYIILGVITLFVCVVVLQVVFIRKNCLKLTLDESICFMFFLTLIGLGLSNVYIYEFSIFNLFLSLVVFVSVAISNPTLTYCLVLSLSFGAGLRQQHLQHDLPGF